MSELAGKVALVTGATGDIGAAIAMSLAQAGAQVHASGRRPDKLAKLQERGEGRIVVHAIESSEPGTGTRLVETLGRVDVLVCNAAHPPEKAPFLQGGMPVLRSVMEVNFFAAAELCLAVLPGMVERGWGRLIAISSLAASIGEAHGPSYCASKAGLDGLFRNLAIDYSPAGITVNTIEPGAIETSRLASHGDTKMRRLAMASVVRRLGLPEDVAYAVAFLASPQAGFVTGETLRVDGGLHLGNPLSALYVRPSSRENVSAPHQS